MQLHACLLKIKPNFSAQTRIRKTTKITSLSTLIMFKLFSKEFSKRTALNWTISIAKFFGNVYCVDNLWIGSKTHIASKDILTGCRGLISWPCYKAKVRSKHPWKVCILLEESYVYRLVYVRSVSYLYVYMQRCLCVAGEREEVYSYIIA